MKILSALLTLSVAAVLMVSAQFTCETSMYCPCGSTSKHIVVCIDTESEDSDPCGKWSRCKSCQSRLNKCLQCEDGFEGPLCDIPNKRAAENYGGQPNASFSIQRPAEGRKHLKIDFINYCSNPGPIFNGKIRIVSPGASSEDDEEYPQGTRLLYDCENGFSIQGNSALRCLSTGFWSSEPPTCIADCGRTFVQKSNRVFKNHKSLPGEWPWVVAVSVQKNNFTQLICAGALVNSRTVLTAAHCLGVANRFTLSFGKVFRQNIKDDTEVLVRQSTRVIIHPDFNPSTLESDIGLLMFEPRIRFSLRVQPICLPTVETTVNNLNSGKLGYVAGWGLTERELPAEILRAATLPVVTNEVCIQSYKNRDQDLSLTRNMFCAGSDQGQEVPCRGDGGAPLVFYDRLSQRFTVEGLVSFGAAGKCGVPGTYAVFTKVFRFIPWILRNLQ